MWGLGLKHTHTHTYMLQDMQHLNSCPRASSFEGQALDTKKIDGLEEVQR